MNLKRRQFVKNAGASGAAGVLGLFAGCASLRGGSRPQVVVIGGGYGGATAAKYVRLWSGHGIDVTLVEPNASFISCPLSNLVVGGSKSMADITTPYDGLVRHHGVRLVQDRAVRIDPDRQIAVLSSGAELPYDRLIVSPGVDFMWGHAARHGP